MLFFKAISFLLPINSVEPAGQQHSLAGGAAERCWDPQDPAPRSSGQLLAPPSHLQLSSHGQGAPCSASSAGRPALRPGCSQGQQRFPNLPAGQGWEMCSLPSAPTPKAGHPLGESWGLPCARWGGGSVVGLWGVGMWSKICP